MRKTFFKAKTAKIEDPQTGISDRMSERNKLFITINYSRLIVLEKDIHRNSIVLN